MVFFLRSLLLVLGILLMVFVIACGETANTGRISGKQRRAHPHTARC
jgi:hypothetical protein